MSAWVASAPSTSPPSCSRIPRSSATRWMATRASGSGALPPRAPTTRSVPPAIGAGAGGHRLQRLVDRGGGGVGRGAHRCIASHTRAGVIGSSCTRAPVTCAIAFAIAPGVGTQGGSPMPLEPFGPPAPGLVGESTQSMLDRRRVARRLQLVVEQVRVQLAAVLADQRALQRGHADAHDDAALDLAVGADRVQHAARLVHRGHLQHPHDAGLAIDLAAHGVRDERGREERLHPQPAGAAGGVAVGHLRHRVGAAAEQQRCCRGRPRPAPGW